jgi:hypothetical protein
MAGDGRCPLRSGGANDRRQEFADRENPLGKSTLRVDLKGALRGVQIVTVAREPATDSLNRCG